MASPVTGGDAVRLTRRGGRDFILKGDGRFATDLARCFWMSTPVAGDNADAVFTRDDVN